MTRQHVNAFSVGEGGDGRAAFLDFAIWKAKERLYDVDETSAGMVLTVSPERKLSFVGNKDFGIAYIMPLAEYPCA